MLVAPMTQPLYVVHKRGNPLVWPVKDAHAVVTFSSFKTAATIATLAESHYLTHKEWPNGTTFSFKDQVTPTILGIQEVELDEIAALCSVWDLRLLIIDSLHKNKYAGELRQFDIDSQSRVNHLNSLWYPSA